MQKARGHPARGLPQLVSARFQDLFHSPSGVLFTFPSRYWFAIGHRRVFSLGRWSCQIPAKFLVLRGTWELNWRHRGFRLQACHLLRRAFPDASTSRMLGNSMAGIGPRLSVPQPRCHNAPTLGMTPVWALPRSLAATWGITVVFFSSGYLDVSVPRVRFPFGMVGHDPDRVAPFGNPRIYACVPLPEAYRSLPRPSSPVCAKASTVRSWILDHSYRSMRR
jgi:hypothetical protein